MYTLSDLQQTKEQIILADVEKKLPEKIEEMMILRNREKLTS